MRTTFAILLIAALACSCGRRVHRALDLPPLMLWAWQRPENLTFIDPKTTGVAYLAGTAEITATGFPAFTPRLQPLSIPKSASVLAVVRIESQPVHAPLQVALLAQVIEGVATAAKAQALQIDFDARLSERASYRSLLRILEAHSKIPVGLTALASWCEGDRWLDREPIAEAVPMFFRMGRNESREMRISSTICSSSIGLSTDEPWPSRRPSGLERVYMFSPQAWTSETYQLLLHRLGGWK